MVTLPPPCTASFNVDNTVILFLIYNLNLPLEQLEAISSHPITCYLGEETNTHLATASFQVVVERSNVSPQPLFLQTEQPQFPQLLITGLDL